MDKKTILLGRPNTSGGLTNIYLNVQSEEKIKPGDEIKSIGIILKIETDVYNFINNGILTKTTYIDLNSKFLQCFIIKKEYEYYNYNLYKIKSKFNIINEIRKIL